MSSFVEDHFGESLQATRKTTLAGSVAAAVDSAAAFGQIVEIYSYNYYYFEKMIQD